MDIDEQKYLETNTLCRRRVVGGKLADMSNSSMISKLHGQQANCYKYARKQKKQ